MKKTILLTGATDGIGLEAAKKLLALGHNVLLHGRNSQKLADVAQSLALIPSSGNIDSYVADLSVLAEVESLASAVSAKYQKIDVLINNAGVFKMSNAINAQGFDARFMVNTIAPFLLTKRLLPLLGKDSRVVNLSSAAQAPVNLTALAAKQQLSDNMAYAQSKLALTMWSFELAKQLGDTGPAIIALNPKSLLATNMVKDAYGIAGSDLSVGADILVESALSAEFGDATGRYFDNDIAQFSDPHPDALDPQKRQALWQTIEQFLKGEQA